MKRRPDKWIERRRFERKEPKVKSVIPARYRDTRGTETQVELAVLDISEGGLRVKSDTFFPEGEFNLTLELSDLQPGLEGQLILPCEIAWKRRLQGRTWIYGLEFVASLETSEALTQFLKGLMPVPAQPSSSV